MTNNQLRYKTCSTKCFNCKFESSSYNRGMNLVCFLPTETTSSLMIADSFIILHVASNRRHTLSPSYELHKNIFWHRYRKTHKHHLWMKMNSNIEYLRVIEFQLIFIISKNWQVNRYQYQTKMHIFSFSWFELFALTFL